MADEEEVVDVGNTGGSQKLVIILIILSVLVMVVTPIVTIFVFKTMAGKPTTGENSKKDKMIHIPLSEIRFMVDGTGGTRFGQMEVVFQVNNASMKKYFEKQDEQNPDGRFRKIRAVVRGRAEVMALNSLLSPDGKARLLKQIKDDVNDLLSGEAEGTIVDVYIADFLIQ